MAIMLVRNKISPEGMRGFTSDNDLDGEGREEMVRTAVFGYRGGAQAGLFFRWRRQRGVDYQGRCGGYSYPRSLGHVHWSVFFNAG